MTITSPGPPAPPVPPTPDVPAPPPPPVVVVGGVPVLTTDATLPRVKYSLVGTSGYVVVVDIPLRTLPSDASPPVPMYIAEPLSRPISPTAFPVSHPLSDFCCVVNTLSSVVAVVMLIVTACPNWSPRASTKNPVMIDVPDTADITRVFSSGFPPLMSDIRAKTTLLYGFVILVLLGKPCRCCLCFCRKINQGADRSRVRQTVGGLAKIPPSDKTPSTDT